MNPDLDPVNDEDDCGCDWPSGCAGLGVLYCGGCGGDLCVCVCGGEADCFGCDECRGEASEDFDPADDTIESSVVRGERPPLGGGSR